MNTLHFVYKGENRFLILNSRADSDLLMDMLSRMEITEAAVKSEYNMTVDDLLKQYGKK